MSVFGVYRIARDFAKVFPNRHSEFGGRKFEMALEPDGQATGCNPVQVGSIPTGVSIKSD